LSLFGRGDKPRGERLKNKNARPRKEGNKICSVGKSTPWPLGGEQPLSRITPGSGDTVGKKKIASPNWKNAVRTGGCMREGGKKKPVRDKKKELLGYEDEFWGKNIKAA